MQVPEWIGRAAVSGSIASITSTATLAACGARDCASALAPVNAVSHWIWGERALRQDDASWAYTATGYGIHHAMSVLWALGYEAWRSRRPERRRLRLSLVGGVAVAAGACLVDLRCTPERLTPGFERRLTPGALACVYGAFALGLALWRWSEARQRDAAEPRARHSRKRDTPRGERPSRAVSGPGSPTLPRSSMDQVSLSSSTPGT